MVAIPRDIVFTRYGGSRAGEWLRQSYAMFSQERLAWVLLLFAYYFALMVIVAIPFVGETLAFVLRPVFAVGFLAATWTQERGGVPALSQLFQGFRSNLWRLVPLGIVFIVGTQLALASGALIDGGKFLAFVTESGATPVDEAALYDRWQQTFGDTRVQAGLLFSTLCALPTVLALWWASALVVFQNATVPLMLPYYAVVLATLHICDYVSYRDVFHAGETLAPLTRTGNEKAR